MAVQRGVQPVDGGDRLWTIERPFAAAVRRRRREAGLTQEELAERAGLAELTIRNTERGKTTPQWQNFLGLAGALGLSRERSPEEFARFEAAWRAQRAATFRAGEPSPDQSSRPMGDEQPAAALALSWSPVRPALDWLPYAAATLLGAVVAVSLMLLLDSPLRRAVCEPPATGDTPPASHSAVRSSGVAGATASPDVAGRATAETAGVVLPRIPFRLSALYPTRPGGVGGWRSTVGDRLAGWRL